jgi:iron complex outermembrane receptor protein
VGTFPDPRCPQNLNTDPLFPASKLLSFGTADGQGRCRYNYGGVSAQEAENDTKSFFVNTNYEINEATTFFARGTFTSNETFARSAPSPFTQPLPHISQANPNNPTQPLATNTDGQPFSGQAVDTDGDGIADLDGPFEVSIFYRNVPGGFRDSFFRDTLVDYLAGVQGTVDWLGGMDWELSGQWSQQTSNETQRGLGLASFLQADIDSGAFDPFAVTTPFGPDQVARQQAGATTGFTNSRTRVVTIDGQINFDALQIKNGAVPVVLGFEYRDDDFEQDFDEQANSGNRTGSTAVDVSGARTVKSLFAETSVPLLSHLETRFAVRYDDYNDFGTTVNPQVAAGYRPVDKLLFRASWGKGLRAPNMSELYASETLISERGIDSTRCAADPLGDPNTGRAAVPDDQLPPGNPCRGESFQTRRGGNRMLDPETSDQWGAGIVWSPLDDLSVSFDWYDIEIEDQITGTLSQRNFDDELILRQRGASGTTVGRVTRKNNGRVDFVDGTNDNVARTETDGFDVEASYGFSFTRIGDFRTTLQWTHVNEYERDFGDGLGPGDPNFFDPRDRATFGVNWALGDFSANVIGNYISSSSIDAGEVALDDLTTWDVQLGYATPWNGQVTIGARNIFDKDPPTSRDLGGSFYSNGLHDVYGRVPYFRYEQDL